MYPSIGGGQWLRRRTIIVQAILLLPVLCIQKWSPLNLVNDDVSEESYLCKSILFLALQQVASARRVHQLAELDRSPILTKAEWKSRHWLILKCTGEHIAGWIPDADSVVVDALSSLSLVLGRNLDPSAARASYLLLLVSSWLSTQHVLFSRKPLMTLASDNVSDKSNLLWSKRVDESSRAI